MPVVALVWILITLPSNTDDRLYGLARVQPGYYADASSCAAAKAVFDRSSRKLATTCVEVKMVIGTSK